MTENDDVNPLGNNPFLRIAAEQDQALKATASRQTAPTDIMSPDEVAALLQIERRTVLEYAKRGELPSIRISERKIRFHRDDVNEFIATKRGT